MLHRSHLDGYKMLTILINGYVITGNMREFYLMVLGCVIKLHNLGISRKARMFLHISHVKYMVLPCLALFRGKFGLRRVMYTTEKTGMNLMNTTNLSRTYIHIHCKLQQKRLNELSYQFAWEQFQIQIRTI